MATTKPTRSQCYSLAEAELKRAHRDEFEAILARTYAANGYDYKARLTKEERAEILRQKRAEKAADRVRRLVEEHGQGILPVTPAVVG